MTQQKRQFLNFLVVQVLLHGLSATPAGGLSTAWQTYNIGGSRFLRCRLCALPFGCAQSKRLSHNLRI